MLISNVITVYKEKQFSCSRSVFFDKLAFKFCASALGIHIYIYILICLFYLCVLALVWKLLAQTLCHKVRDDPGILVGLLYLK